MFKKFRNKNIFEEISMQIQEFTKDLIFTRSIFELNSQKKALKIIWKNSGILLLNVYHTIVQSMFKKFTIRNKNIFEEIFIQIQEFTKGLIFTRSIFELNSQKKLSK